MQNQTEARNLEKISMKAFVTVTLVIMLLTLTMQVPRIRAEATTQILTYPTLVQNANIGDNVTITFNVTNVAELYNWQVALKYNGTVINCTAISMAGNVFAGQYVIPVATGFGKDVQDNLDWILCGQSLLFNAVAVSNGILFRANFTVVGYGSTTILIATKDKPVKFGQHDQDTWYTFLLDFQDIPQEIPYTTKEPSCTIITEAMNAKPIAIFSVVPPIVVNTTQLVLEGHRPMGEVRFAQTYKGYEIDFNGSESYDPDGNITTYIWDFGDGNVTVTNDTFITHTYDSTGTYTAWLVVVDDGDPPAKSDPVPCVIIVGLVLQYFDWMPFGYGVFAIVAVLVILYAVQKTRNWYLRLGERRKKQLQLAKPPTR
jgi:hypothetical protein